MECEFCKKCFGDEIKMVDKMIGKTIFSSCPQCGSVTTNDESPVPIYMERIGTMLDPFAQH